MALFKSIFWTILNGGSSTKVHRVSPKRLARNRVMAFPCQSISPSTSNIGKPPNGVATNLHAAHDAASYVTYCLSWWASRADQPASPRTLLPPNGTTSWRFPPDRENQNRSIYNFPPCWFFVERELGTVYLSYMRTLCELCVGRQSDSTEQIYSLQVSCFVII